MMRQLTGTKEALPKWTDLGVHAKDRHLESKCVVT